MPKRLRTLLLSLVILLSLFSCGKDRFTTLVRKNLFSLKLGVMEDELDYYFRENLYLPGKSDLFMSDGLFYVSSSNMSKIMGFNSYGDLLFLLMDQKKNPQPRMAKSGDSGSGRSSNTRYATWPFREIGQIALDREILLVEDQVTEDKSVYDESLESLCSRIILRFDRDGKYLDFLGKEGIGGTPFPYITDIRVRENGEFLVICQVSLGEQIFWYSPKGELLYHVIIDNDNLPLLDEGTWGSLVSLSCHPTLYKLYILADYYPEEMGSDWAGSERRLYTFDLNTGKYDGGTKIPEFSVKSEGKEMRYIYDLLGTTSSGIHLLLSRTGGTANSLIALNEEGKTLFNRSLELFDSPEIFNTYYLSDEGMLMALTYLDTKAEVSWWRSDKLLDKE
ncbi:MAG: hypothetical protein JXA95_15735 [Spirochaetales bacterium]|nr:hypothetical protein [Spirochaetales bacterium]